MGYGCLWWLMLWSCNIPIFYLDVLHLEHLHFIMASFENFAFACLHLFQKNYTLNPILRYSKFNKLNIYMLGVLCKKIPFYSQLWQRGILQIFQNWFDSFWSSKSKVITKTDSEKENEKKEKKTKAGRTGPNTGPAASLSFFCLLFHPGGPAQQAAAAIGPFDRSTIPSYKFVFQTLCYTNSNIFI